jgi:hypothetical protein
MPGHSRSKNGVASLAYVPRIHALPAAWKAKTWMAGSSPAMTVEENLGSALWRGVKPVPNCENPART